MPDSDLAGLQTWMLARVTSGAWGQGVVATDGIEASDVLRGSSTLSADERLDIYARSYVVRLAECLRAEFPVLRALIGAPTFDLFAGGYLSARPPSSPSLYDLGAGFADYLDATRPQPRSGPGTVEALPSSLARLERAVAESSRARGPEDARCAVDLAALLYDPRARLRTPVSLQLLHLDFDFTGAFEAAHAGRRPQPPEPRDTLVAVARSRYRVSVHMLDPLQFAWLEALRGCAGLVMDAIHRAAATAGEEPATAMARLLPWIVRAIDSGFVLAT
jgi:hypothetical protein